MRKLLAVVAIAAVAAVAFVSLRGGSASKPDATTSTNDSAQPQPDRVIPEQPLTAQTPLPDGVPTRAQANAPRAEPPARPMPESTDVASPEVSAELVETKRALEDRARECVTGMHIDLDVQMVFREGEAHVREATVATPDVAADTKRCIEERLLGHSWTMSADDKVFGMMVPLEL